MSEQEQIDAACQPCGGYSPTLSVVIASRNEAARLGETIASVRETAPNATVIAVDDASEPPERHGTLRLPERQGVSGARASGFEAVETETVAFTDAHMRFDPKALTTAARMAHELKACVYVGCNGHHAAELRVDQGIIRCKWTNPPLGSKAVLATGMMGACYVWRTDQLEAMGGWVRMPGFWGMDEEAMSILCAKHNVPIYALTLVENWHDFVRPQPFHVPGDHYVANIAAVYALLFERPVWDKMRERLSAGFVLDGAHLRLSPEWAETLDGPEWQEYGRALRERCALDDAAFFNQYPECRL